MIKLILPALLLLPACGDKDDDSGTTAGDDTATDTVGADLPDYSLPGEFSPGTLSMEITGSTGVELTVQVWFPADAPGAETVVYDGLYAGNATTDAIPTCDDARPVMVFSHGYGGVRWQSGFLVEHLASHGYIVVAPDHTYNTTFDNDDSRFEEVVVRRPQDLADAFDWAVAQSEDASSVLSGCLDGAEGYAVSGHSFGGYTAYAAAGASLNLSGNSDLSDDRVWAAVPMAPWDVNGTITDGTADITVPLMCLSGTLDTTTSWDSVGSMFSAATATPRYLGEFPEAGHYSFSPIACDFGTTDNGCGEDYIALDTFAGLVNTAVTAFLEESRGVTGAIGQLPDSGDVVWQMTE
ncbi:MAG: putative dienelactone hydrolase [Myxococcota bacterium]|jgi:predicted dienelactone hydrolase